MTRIKLVLLSLCLLIPISCAQNLNNSSVSPRAPIIRVRLLAAQDQVVLSSSAPVTAKSSGEPDARQLDFAGSAGITVALTPQGWRVGNATFAPGDLTFQPGAVGGLRVNGTAYRGNYRLIPSNSGRFDVINDVDIDSYLMSVVSSEMLRDWQLEAYKAQAIAARTYALYEARTMGTGRSFDVYDDTKSQVYNGIAGENDKARQAAADTAGVVVAFGPRGQERIFKAYFSSCCGGIGQSAYDAFGDADLPPLREKFVGNLCNASPRFNWGPIVLKKDELTRRVKSWGAKKGRPEKDMATIARVEVGAVNQFRRPVRFIITDARGQQYSLSGEEFRWAFNSDANGGPILNSSLVRPISDADTIQLVEGHGWGHGVGLCQWCAEVRSERGQRHEEIIRLAYPGAVLVRAY